MSNFSNPFMSKSPLKANYGSPLNQENKKQKKDKPLTRAEINKKYQGKLDTKKGPKGPGHSGRFNELIGKKVTSGDKGDSALNHGSHRITVNGHKHGPNGVISPLEQKIDPVTVGENTGKVKKDRKGLYTLRSERSVAGAKGDTIRIPNKKFVKGGYLMGGDYETKKIGDKSFEITKQK